MLILSGCVPAARPNAPVLTAAATIEQERTVQSDRICSGRFVTHELAHETTVPGNGDVRMFAANGGGVAVNDLDNDGDLDIVMANHAGMNSILWNQGGLAFRREAMTHGDSRAVQIVDLDGDGWNDIVFTRRVTAPTYWHNNRDGSFSFEPLAGVDKPLYAMNWADLDADDDLDLVGATYDAALLTEFGYEFLNGAQAGVYYFENNEGRFKPTRLAGNAQALALALLDLNDDGRLDILVGNDFGVPDYAWLAVDGADPWLALEPFASTTHSTMSLDFGDIDNDGRDELFATDMKPYADDPDTRAAWRPIMESMMNDPHPEGDRQVMENVLQVNGNDNGFANEAAERGLDATGWSWSAKFGDLDQDGFLDLYVVNGFMEMTTFAHLPDHELVEENQVLRNDGNGRFLTVPEWGLGSTQSGRGMSMADLDEDGDLDIVVNNLRGRAQLFENQLCRGGSLQVDLSWNGHKNGRALGARATLVTETGTYYRQLKAASGYLSGDPARIHFGFPAGNELDWLEIRWPDGEISAVTQLEADTIIAIHR